MDTRSQGTSERSNIVDFSEAFAAIDVQRKLLKLKKHDPLIMDWFHERGVRGWEWAEMEDLRSLWSFLNGKRKELWELYKKLTSE